MLPPHRAGGGPGAGTHRRRSPPGSLPTAGCGPGTARCGTAWRSYSPPRRGPRYLRMLTARATTRATVTIDTVAWAVMAILAQRDSGRTSVGLNAAALVKDRYR